MIADDLLEMNRHVAYALWNVASSTSPPSGLSPRLVFPDLRSGETRVCEQEARLLWCTMLQETSYYYAIEAPTTKTYIQKGKSEKGTSARTDVALYDASGSSLHRVANIEFKTGSPKPEEIRKDLEKLIREEINDNWFHLLSARDSGTLPSLSKKFITDFNKCSSFVNHDVDIVFCICVLQKKQMFTRRFRFLIAENNFISYVSNFFANIDKWSVGTSETPS